MAESVELYCSWTVDQLKAFLRERRVPLSGNKEQLVKKVADIVTTDDLEGQIQAVPFQCTESCIQFDGVNCLKVLRLCIACIQMYIIICYMCVHVVYS